MRISLSKSRTKPVFERHWLEVEPQFSGSTIGILHRRAEPVPGVRGGDDREASQVCGIWIGLWMPMTVSSVKGAEGNLKAEAEDQIWPELKSPVRTGGSAA